MTITLQSIPGSTYDKEADAKSIQLIKKPMIQKYKTCQKVDETIMHNQETRIIQCTYNLHKKIKS